MKKYIIMTYDFSGLGGAELYVRDKQEYMLDKNWKVFLLCGGKAKTPEEIYITDLQRYSEGVFSFLNYYPVYFSKRIRMRYVDKICDHIGYIDGDEILIESNNLKVACWGEMLAQKCHGKNFCYILNENFHGDCLDFMNFKHLRNELAGTYDDSLIKMFDGYKNIPPNERYYLTATNSQVVKDIPYDKLPSKKNYDWVIGSIGRLEKPYVRWMIKAVNNFAKKYCHKKILLILVASDENNKTKLMIKDEVTSSNLEIMVTGVLFPIPKVIFAYVDLFISSATSAQISASEGTPTITVDGNDYKGIGILGYTTSEDLYHSSKKDIFEIDELIEQVLIHNVCDSIPFDPNLVWLFKQKDWKNILDAHLDLINRSASEKQYYDLNSRFITNYKHILLNCILYRILGLKIINKFKTQRRINNEVISK